MNGRADLDAPHLHVVALNDQLEESTTFLSRQAGDPVPDTAGLAEALGLPALDASHLELFPVKDLGDMRLSDYIQEAFAPAGPVDADTRARLNAIDGHVMLLLEEAIPPGASIQAGPRARLIASMPLEQPDHSADLPKANSASPPPEPTPLSRPEPSRRNSLRWLLALLAIGALILVIGGLN